VNIKEYGPAYPALLVISSLAALGAVLTLIPNPGASWPNILGYKSICTFAPGATFGCALVAAITCTIRARLIRRWTFPAFVPAAAIALLAIGFAVSTAAWTGEKVKYAKKGPDAITAVSK
jgi:ABC-type Fe3+-siderophore transport system permease subunit